MKDLVYESVVENMFTQLERQLHGLLSLNLIGVDVTVDEGTTGDLHFAWMGGVVSIERSAVVAAGEDIEEMGRDLELRLRRAALAN
jgi:hypothetical protein